MEPAFFVMAIMGCADDGMACRQERIEPARYASAAQCQSAISSALERHTDLDYPVVAASCMRDGKRFAERASARARPRS